MNQLIVNLENKEGINKEFIIDKFDAITGVNFSTKVSQAFGGILTNGELTLQNIDLELWTQLIPKLLQKTSISKEEEITPLTENEIAKNFVDDYAMLDELAFEVVKFNGFLDRFGLGSIPELLKVMKSSYSLQMEYKRLITAEENKVYEEENKILEKKKKPQKNQK